MCRIDGDAYVTASYVASAISSKDAMQRLSTRITSKDTDRIWT